MCKASQKLPFRPKEKMSPRDIIKMSQITVFDDMVSIKVPGRVTIAEIANTNSMDGLMDIGHNVLLLKEFDRNALEVGDVIVYAATVGKIIHRIVEKGIDMHGSWFKCKGDNNFKKDPYLIRGVNITSLCIGIIY